MKKQYFGDITDFYKFFFLKNIIGEYTLGIHWCMTPDDGSNDGKSKVRKKPTLKDIDGELYDILVEKEFANIQTKYFGKNVKYYGELLEHYFMEYAYEVNAFDALKSQEIIFFDPDNGIETPSTKMSKRNKFVSYRTMAKYWNNNNSLIIFQHKDRERNSLKAKKANLMQCLKCKETNILIVNTKKVYYICLINEKHKNIVANIHDFCKENQKLGYAIENV